MTTGFPVHSVLAAIVAAAVCTAARAPFTVTLAVGLALALVVACGVEAKRRDRRIGNADQAHRPPRATAGGDAPGRAGSKRAGARR